MKNFEQSLDQYAELSVRKGVNIQKDQTLIINAPIEAVEYVRKVAKKAYEAGAKNVHIFWKDDQLTHLKLKNAPAETLNHYPQWQVDGRMEMAAEGAAYMAITSPNPDLFSDVDPDRAAMLSKAASKALEIFKFEYISPSKISWLVIGVPNVAWAKKLFPDLSEEKAMEKLWTYIFKINRIDTEDPIKAWDQHLDTLNEKLDYLNKMKFKKLHYKAPGTDLTIELPEKHLWMGGDEITQSGITNICNIPTEEVFTLPLKTGVNGTVTSTKPFNYNGTLIENFTLTFEKGRIVHVKAEKGEKILKQLIDSDEGSHYLGEVALVPHESPISQLDTIFYDTLYDENASCHLAIGSAYPICLEEGTKMSKEEMEQNGANNSMTHEDFMIGSAELNIDGETADGKIIPLFRNGNWA
jgi:aminopeptidase